MTKTKLYTIPIEDKYIIYAPLKQIAFIGNKALADAVKKQLKKPLNGNLKQSETVQSLNDIGLFEPDPIKFPACNCKQPFIPTLCILMPTTACNLACTYCYADNGSKKTVTMSWDIAKKGIDVAFENAKNPKNGKFSLSFHGGGEPSLPKELILKSCKYARALDSECPISITSNCVWDAEYRSEILSLVNEVSISFDGNKRTQDRQRPDKNMNGTFERVMESIKEIEQRNISYGIRMTVTKESLSELYSNIEFLCDNTACHSFQVEAVYDQGKAEGAGLKITDVEKFVDSFMEAYDLAKSKGRNISYSSARPHQITNTFCTATSSALIVTSDGELTACYEVFDRSHPLADDFIIGKLHLQKGIELFPEKREQLLQKIENNKNDCVDCFCYYHCAGDCPPKAFMAKRSNDKFRCSVTRKITKALIIDKLIEGNGIWNGNKKRQLTIEPLNTKNII